MAPRPDERNEIGLRPPTPENGEFRKGKDDEYIQGDEKDESKEVASEEVSRSSLFAQKVSHLYKTFQ